MSKSYDNKWQEHMQVFTKQIQEFQSIASELSKKTNDIDHWLQLVGNFSTAIEDKEKRKKMVSALANMDQKDDSKKEALSGDTLYDLFTSPNMTAIVKEVMQHRRGKS